MFFFKLFTIQPADRSATKPSRQPTNRDSYRPNSIPTYKNSLLPTGDLSRLGLRQKEARKRRATSSLSSERNNETNSASNRSRAASMSDSPDQASPVNEKQTNRFSKKFLPSPKRSPANSARPVSVRSSSATRYLQQEGAAVVNDRENAACKTIMEPLNRIT